MFVSILSFLSNDN